MKKISSLVLIVVLAVLAVVSFSACEKLKPSNLKANSHLKTANRLYRQEKFRKAAEEYQAAIELNPELKIAYLYLGTSYAVLFKPGKDTEKNKEYADNAVKYLQEALEVESEANREKVILALGDMFDKLGNYEEAEKYYLMILDNKPDDPKTYYILADFYSKYAKHMEAEKMYERRIQLDIGNPEGYLYYANYLKNRGQFDMAIRYHNKRINVMINPEIEKVQVEVDKLNQTIVNIEKIKDFMETVKQNRAVSQEEKDRLLNEKTEQLKELGNPEELNAQLEEKNKELKAKYEQKDEIIKSFSEEKKHELAVAYYTIGAVCWGKSFSSNVDMMGSEERLQVVKTGLDALDKAAELSPEYPHPWVYMRLLYIEKIKAEPLKREEHMKKVEEFGEKFTRLRKKQQAAEEYQRKLEQLGET